MAESVRVDLGIMAMKRYFTLPWTGASPPAVVSCHYQYTCLLGGFLWKEGSFTSLHGIRWHILSSVEKGDKNCSALSVILFVGNPDIRDCYWPNIFLNWLSGSPLERNGDPIYQLLRSGGIWHKVKFLSGV